MSQYIRADEADREDFVITLEFDDPVRQERLAKADLRSPEYRKRVAFHEAGHVVAYLALGGSGRHVRIDMVNLNTLRPGLFSPGLEALVELAGEAAESHALGGAPKGGKGDRAGILKVLQNLEPETAPQLLEEIANDAREMLEGKDTWAAVERLAAFAERHEVVRSDRIRDATRDLVVLHAVLAERRAIRPWFEAAGRK
jgi:hypothetical protein